jgi:hypothetical protein
VRRVTSVVATFVLAIASIATSASAQTAFTRWPSSVAIDAPVVRLYVDQDPFRRAPAIVEVPSNVVVADLYVSEFRSMLGASATFRRQCARIAAAHHLTVTVMPAVLADLRSNQAFTRMAFRRDGSIRADVTIGAPSALLELLPHEFEHVLEQLDGVDLASMARLRATGVHRAAAGEPFETERAIAAGRQVAREIREWRRGGV